MDLYKNESNHTSWHVKLKSVFKFQICQKTEQNGHTSPKLFSPFRSESIIKMKNKIALLKSKTTVYVKQLEILTKRSISTD